MNVLQCLRQYSEQLPNLCPRTLGIQLDVPSVKLYAIEHDYPRSIETRREKVIQHWISSPSLQPSWCSLADALDSMNYRNAAQRIAEQHSKQYACKTCTIFYVVLFSLFTKPILVGIPSRLNTFPLWVVHDFITQPMLRYPFSFVTMLICSLFFVG